MPVRDGETLRFAPGGRHLMLFDLDPRVRAGGRLRMVLNFERGAPRALDAEVVPADADTGR